MEVIINNLVCIFDDEDYTWLQDCKLRVDKHNKNYYVYISNISAHKLILACNGIPIIKGTVIDHINRNSLDNRKINLRQIANYDNLKHNTKKRRGTSKYIGVRKGVKKGTWIAYCDYGPNRNMIGTYESEVEAAKAHDWYMIQEFRNPLRLNFPVVFYSLKKMFGKVYE